MEHLVTAPNQLTRENMLGAGGNAVPKLPLGCRRHIGLWRSNTQDIQIPQCVI